VLSGYQAGFELVEGVQPSAIERFTVVRLGGVPRLLLPPSQPIMRTALASFVGERRSTVLIPPLLQLASTIGGPFSRVCSSVSFMSESSQVSPLRELVSEVLGRNDYQLALRVSFGRPNAKTVAMAIADSGEALCYLKIGTEAMTNSLVAHESAVLEQLEGSEMPVITPRRLYAGTWANEHNVLITAPIKQLEPLKQDARDAHVAAAALVSQRGVVSGKLADSEYWRSMIARVEQFDHSEALKATMAEVERLWGADDFDFGVSHGDWTRANVGMVGSRVAALDWERCSEHAPNAIDIAHFVISEKTSKSFSGSLNVERVLEKVRRILGQAELSSSHAEPLIAFALLEMVIRFKSAENAGVQSTDFKFGPALKECLQKWA